MSHIKQDLTPHAAETVYKVMIIPLLLCSNNIFIDISPNKKHQFEKMQMRCLKIINSKRDSVKLPLIYHIRNKMCAIEVFKCLNGISPPECKEYCQHLDHCKGTRGKDHRLLLPKVKSEGGRKTFGFLGAKIFNKISNNMKTESSIVKIKTARKDLTLTSSI